MQNIEPNESLSIILNLVSVIIKYLNTRNIHMLHEYKDEIHNLKQENAHFAHIFEKHNALDDKIAHAENGDIPLTDVELETLKKEKLLLKDEAYKMIMDYKQSKA